MASGYNGWEKPQHPKGQYRKVFENALLNLIVAGNGSFKGKYIDILNACNLPPQDFYGDLFGEMNEILKANKLTRKSCGRSGNLYF